MPDSSSGLSGLRDTIATKVRYGSGYRRIQERRAMKDAQTWTLVDERMRSFYSRFFAHGDIVFDVGANWGNRTKVFMAMGATVVAVEPQPALAAALRTNYYRLSNLRIVEAAVTAEPGSIELYLGDADTLTTTNRDWVASVQASGRFGDRHWDRTITVEALTLDQLIERFGEPTFVKIDIEGGEVAALRGLTRSVHAVSFEFTPERVGDAEACVAHLEELGIHHFSLAMGEAMQFVDGTWRDGAGIRELLAEYAARTNRDLFGDVYALRELG